MSIKGSTSEDKLNTCDERIQQIVREVAKTIDIVVVEGHRDEAAQELAFQRGTTRLHYPHGKHNSVPSKAVDIMPAALDWRDQYAIGRMQGYVQRVAQEMNIPVRFGIDWDKDFRTRNETFVDGPHFELVEESDHVG